MDDFYVYVILNLEEGGEFKYGGDVKFDFMPIYIGKGRNKRQFAHFMDYSLKHESEKNKSLLKYNCVSKVLKDGLSEVESFKLERYYIEIIGRKNLDKGPLLNLTSGGQGASGYKYTPEQLIKRSKEQSTIGNHFYGKKHDKNTFNKFKRSVYQIDIETNEIINEFDSLSDAAIKTKSRETHIRDCCNGLRKSHNGFKWKDVNIDYVKKRASKNNNTAKRKILQLSLDGEILNEYESISLGSKITGIRKCNIINCLSGGKKSAGGFKWVYKQNENKIMIKRFKKFNESKKDKFPNVQKIDIDGFIVYVGKDAKSNDYLTFNMTSPDDVWFHVRGVPGSHVVIKVKENLPTESVIKFAAELAKKNSKAVKEEKVTIVYCKVKFIRKESGMNDGQVTLDYKNSYEIVI